MNIQVVLLSKSPSDPLAAQGHGQLRRERGRELFCCHFAVQFLAATSKGMGAARH